MVQTERPRRQSFAVPLPQYCCPGRINKIVSLRNVFILSRKQLLCGGRTPHENYLDAVFFGSDDHLGRMDIATIRFARINREINGLGYLETRLILVGVLAMRGRWRHAGYDTEQGQKRNHTGRLHIMSSTGG